MYRISKMTGTHYAKQIDLEDKVEVSDIIEFAEQGVLVCICDDLETYAEEVDIDVDDIVTV